MSSSAVPGGVKTGRKVALEALSIVTLSHGDMMGSYVVNGAMSAALHKSDFLFFLTE